MKIGFDNLEQGQKHLRILPNQKITGRTNLVKTAQEWQQKSPIIDQQGHGIKAYLRLIFSLLQSNRAIVVIDEPETFLHPPQRKALGNLIVKLVKEENKQVFIATHDPEFLRGALSSGPRHIKVFYLKPEHENFSFTVLNANDITTLLPQRSRLLDERILNSFFYKKTILCEAEDDRLFYEHASASYCWTLFQDINFVGFNGKSDVLPIFEKLSELAINVAMVLDIDYLSGSERFPKTITDTSLRTKFSSFRQKITTLISQGNFDKEEFKREGIGYIRKTHSNILVELESLLENFKSFGVYIVSVGQLESWTQVGHGNLQAALQIIQKKKKRALSNFLKEVLSL